MASRSQPKLKMPDLRFIKTSTLDDLLNPSSEPHMQALADTEEWHKTCSRDLQRRTELSQSIAEACQHIREILPRVAALRPQEATLPSAGQAEAIDEVTYTDELHQLKQPSPTLDSADRVPETQRSLAKMMVETPTAIAATQPPRDSFLQQSSTSSTRTSAESLSNRPLTLISDPSSEHVSNYLPAPSEPLSVVPPAQAPPSDPSARRFCTLTTCPTCHPSLQPKLHPEDQTLPNLMSLAHKWIDRLRMLRAQWNAGGKNFENWAGFAQSQSHWIGQGEDWRQTGTHRGQSGRGTGL